jgi:retron-type reverse transcriptase
MKTYKKLWDEFISKENFNIAAIKAVKSKKAKKTVQRFLNNREVLLEKLRQDVIHGRYKTSPYRTFIIFEPKQRIIYNLPLYPDHILHHALINVLGPIWQKMFIRDSYACIPGRGLHAASHRTMDFMRRNKYVLQCDIRKFYPSIDHKIMMDIVAKKIKDRRILRILQDVVWSVGGDKNLPIGNLTSQWMGNVYLNELDHFVKQQLRWRDYMRYCDDFCLYGNDKQVLWKMAEKIEDFARENLNLVFSKCFIRKTSNGIAFIGYKHFKTHIVLRQWTARKIRRRIINIINHHDRGDHAIGQIAAAYGWAKWACSFNYRKSLLTLARKESRKMGGFLKHKIFR